MIFKSKLKWFFRKRFHGHLDFKSDRSEFTSILPVCVVQRFHFEDIAIDDQMAFPRLEIPTWITISIKIKCMPATVIDRRLKSAEFYCHPRYHIRVCRR